MYVQRTNDKITGAFANLQPGLAEEWLADSDPELQMFLNPPKLNWQGLETSLRNTDLFAIAYGSPDARAFNLLLYAFSNTTGTDVARLADLQFAIAQIRASLPEDYTAEQLQHFRDVLTANGFDSSWVT
jgi:hypothetical protein